jgi:hypothetical protein
MLVTTQNNATVSQARTTVFKTCEIGGLSDFISVAANSTITSEHYSEAYIQRYISTLLFYDFLME